MHKRKSSRHQLVMFLAENLKSAIKCEHRICLVKCIYGLSPNPFTNRKSKNRRIFSSYSCSCFSFCRYIHFREICSRKMNSICFRYAANPQSSSSIYCRSAPIRYEINPSFAQQTYRVRQHISNAIGVYRKSREGFISMRDTPLRVSRYVCGFCYIMRYIP